MKITKPYEETPTYSMIRRQTILLIALLIVGCLYRKPKTFVSTVDEKGTINPIPIRVIENSKVGDLDITASVTFNSQRKMEYLMKGKFAFNNLECSIELPQQIINFDLDYQFINRTNVFLGSQIYSINNSINSTYYLGLGYQWNMLGLLFDTEQAGLRFDLFYYNHDHSYKATILVKDGTFGVSEEPDSIYYIEDTFRYENILPSITFNDYKHNLVFNLSATPYYHDPIQLWVRGIDYNYSTDIPPFKDEVEIYRGINPILSLAYYKKMDYLIMLFGIAWIPPTQTFSIYLPFTSTSKIYYPPSAGYKDDLLKYFIQFTMTFN